MDYVTVPEEILQDNKIVTLAADVFIVNKNAFLATMSEVIKLTTANYISKQMAENLLQGIKEVKDLYTSHGFEVKTTLMDGKFKAL